MPTPCPRLNNGKPTTTRYLVEKHGKGPCDSCIFSPIRRFLDEYCLRPDAFADSAEKIVEILNEAAQRDMQNNPLGPTWHIQVPELPCSRPDSYVIQMHDAQINISYCWQSRLNKYEKHGVEIRNWFFTDSSSYERVSYSVTQKAAEYRDWKKGYWQDPSWKRPPLALGSENSITRKFACQKAFKSSSPPQAKSLEFLCARDEAQLQKHLEKRRRIRAANL